MAIHFRSFPQPVPAGVAISLPLACFAVAVPLLLVPRRPTADTPRDPDPVVAAAPAAEARPQSRAPRRIELIADDPPPPEQAPLASAPPPPPSPGSVRPPVTESSALQYSAIAAVF